MNLRFFPILITILVFLFSQSSRAVETCSRTAIINYQEVLVDSNASDKGEGLRYQIEKDPVALSFLDKYQQNASIKWPNAILGTAGTGLMLMGFFTSNSEDRRTFLITGTTTILINFLVAKTLEVSNEVNLNRAIDEYNKRNLPKIYFTPESNHESSNNFPGLKIAFGKDWSF